MMQTANRMMRILSFLVMDFILMRWMRLVPFTASAAGSAAAVRVLVRIFFSIEAFGSFPEVFAGDLGALAAEQAKSEPIPARLSSSAGSMPPGSCLGYCAVYSRRTFRACHTAICWVSSRRSSVTESRRFQMRFLSARATCSWPLSGWQ